MQPYSVILPPPANYAYEVALSAVAGLLAAWNTWQAKQIRRLQNGTSPPSATLPLLLLCAFGLSATAAEVEVCFSPNGGCQGKIASAIRGATNRVYMQAYAFTAKPIADALAHAKSNRVSVSVVLDPRQLRATSPTNTLKEAGVEVFADGSHAAAHNKAVVVDGHTVITGSYNFTESAERQNAENVVFIRDKALATRYEGNFLLHRHHSRRLF